MRLKYIISLQIHTSWAWKDISPRALSRYCSVYFLIIQFKQLKTNEMTELSHSATAMTYRHSHSEFMMKTPGSHTHSHLNEQCTCQFHTLSTQQMQPHFVLNTPGQRGINIKTFWNACWFFSTLHIHCYTYNQSIHFPNQFS